MDDEHTGDRWELGTREAVDRWKDALGPLVIGVGAAAALAVSGAGPVVAGIALLGGLVGAWWVSPLRRARPHLDQERAAAQAGPDDLIVYWRPGCSYCIKLRAALTGEERDRVLWVNVLADRDAEARLRTLNDGDMLTPTAVTGGGDRVEADVDGVRAHLDA